LQPADRAEEKSRAARPPVNRDEVFDMGHEDVIHDFFIAVFPA